ncbi:hypothetical protein NSB1T_08685 [Coprobacter fastidiosus NSB1 = JCM 33896]|nr:hypothetical protein NSB1T_08685 [Coprobacter fastidiosus NSB1 = JCM 33896]
MIFNTLIYVQIIFQNAKVEKKLQIYGKTVFN